jgi:hypothetical protein
MTRVVIPLTLFLLSFAFLGCAPTKPSVMEKRAIESHVVDGSYRNVYKSCMTVLQDEGYQIKQSDMESGLLVGAKDKEVDTGEQVVGALFFGGAAKKGSVYEITTTFDEIDSAHTNIRINIQSVSYDMAGRKKSARDIVDQPMIQGFLQSVQTEVKRREALIGE